MSKQRLTDADAFEQYLRENVDIWKHPEALDWAICKLQYAPTIDAVPAVHGRWENYPSHAYRRCSMCKAEWEKQKFNIRAKYCPNCGAKMDQEEAGDG